MDDLLFQPRYKLCQRCMVVKSERDFAFSGSADDGLKDYCKICGRSRSTPEQPPKPRKAYVQPKNPHTRLSGGPWSPSLNEYVNLLMPDGQALKGKVLAIIGEAPHRYDIASVIGIVRAAIKHKRSSGPVISPIVKK